MSYEIKKDMRWILDNPKDCIQSHLVNNRFFEIQELEFMKQHIDADTVLIDIGANIGNHSVYFSKFTDAKTIYVVEPVPRAYRLLLANVALNYCHNINLDFIGLALGDRECMGYPHLIYGKDNLGAATISPTPYDSENDLALEPVRVVTGDSLFKDIDVDFIKMDVERMEMVALAGLKETIDRCRPKIFIEVSKQNYEDFDQWLIDNNYKIHSVHEQSKQNIFINYFVIPNEPTSNS
jgi:FkbM family methyltransferase